MVKPHRAIHPAPDGADWLAHLGKGEASPPPLHPPTVGPSGPREHARDSVAPASDMGASPKETVPRRGPKRQRQNVVGIRLDDAESAALESRASESGLSLGAYLRACGLGDAGPRARRRTPVDRVLLAQTNARLNQIGNNINQIARTLNIAALDEDGSELARRVLEIDPQLVASLDELSATLTVLRGAMGHDRQGYLHAHGAKLASYLTTGKDGERAELAELRGFVATNIRDAFLDVQLQAEGTRCEKPFFHAYVRLPADETLTPTQWGFR